MTWKANLAILVVALLAGAAGLLAGRSWYGLNPPTTSLPLGAPALNFELPGLSGETLGPAALRGRVLLVNFWAPWCEPCRREIPLFNALRTEYGEQQLEILGIALDDPQAVRDFIGKYPVHYPVALASVDDYSLMRAYGNGRDALPFSVVIDAEGKLRARKLGEYHEAELRRDIEAARKPLAPVPE